MTTIEYIILILAMPFGFVVGIAWCFYRDYIRDRKT